MENNNYYSQPTQPQYYQPQVIDPEYDAKSKDFLTKAIVSCCICSLPIGSIIAIFMASNNRKAVLDYIAQGGLHTPKIKVCSALSRAGKYGGIGFTVFWAFYLIYFAMFFLVGVLGIIANYGG